MNTHRKFGRSSLGGTGWRATASSRPGRFQTRRNASPESLSREAIFEHRPGGTLTQRPGKRPWTIWTTWLTRKLLWTLRTRRRGREREPQQSEVEATNVTARLRGLPSPGVINPPMSADGTKRTSQSIRPTSASDPKQTLRLAESCTAGEPRGPKGGATRLHICQHVVLPSGCPIGVVTTALSCTD